MHILQKYIKHHKMSVKKHVDEIDAPRISASDKTDYIHHTKYYRLKWPKGTKPMGLSSGNKHMTILVANF